MECLLPSEIARLVFGYLEEQKCEEAAQSFLEHSSYLSECFAVARSGRKFSSRVHGNSLADVLEEYCAVQSLVAERIRKLPENAAEQLRNRVGLVEKLKALLDCTKSGQTVAVSISVLPHGGAAQSSSTQATTHSRSRIAQSTHERKRSIRFQGQENKRAKDKEDRNFSLESSVEATPLDTLPGLAIRDNRSTQTRIVLSCSRTDELEQHDTNTTAVVDNEDFLYSNNVAEQLCGNKTRSHSFSSTSTVPEKDTANESSINTCEVGTSTNLSPKRKSKKKFISAKISPLRFRKSVQHEDDDDNVSATVHNVHRALLNNTEIQEKIAENINSLIRIPNDLGGCDVLYGQVGSEDSEGVVQELNNAIKMVVDKTQEDPVFERLLEEIIGPIDEEMSSSPAGIESETDDACEAPDATPCEDLLGNSIDKNTSNDKISSAVPSEHTKNDIVDRDKSLTVTDVLSPNKRAFVPADVSANSHSNTETTKPCDVVPVASVSNHKRDTSCVEVPENSSSSAKSHGEKSSKRYISNQEVNQGKEKLHSASVGSHSQPSVEVSRKISKKEVQSLLGAGEISTTTMHTPKNDVPLKQRLRSARKSDSNSQGTIKEISSLDRSLEDQNNKAIQFILEANKKAGQLSEKDSFTPSEETNHKTKTPSSSKKSSETLEKSSDNSNIDRINKTSCEQLPSSSQVGGNQINENETNSHKSNSTSQEASKSLNNVFSSGQDLDCGSLQDSSKAVEKVVGKGEHVMMLTIPNIDNFGAPVSTSVSFLQQEDNNAKASMSQSLEDCPSQENAYTEKECDFSQQQQQQHLVMQSSTLPMTALNQNLGNTVTPSKHIVIDEGNSSAVIVCDSNMSFPPVFNQYLKGNDTKGNQAKKMRPIIPRPIRPKPSSFPLQLFTTDITPQYIVTQVPPGPHFEGSNTTVSSSPGLLNVVNVTLPVISPTSEVSKKICICPTEVCGKRCMEDSEKNIDSASAVGTNSEISVDTGHSSVISDHISDSMNNSSTNGNVVIVGTVEQSTSEVCSFVDLDNQGQSSDAVVISKNNQQKGALDMSALLLLPEHEQVPKPRDTPQTFTGRKACLNSRRLSLSTPRRRASHIRALDFGTPLKSGTESTAFKKSHTSPKPVSKNNLETSSMNLRDDISSPPYKPINSQARNVRSSLFTSPDPPSNKKEENKINKQNSDSQVIPIATRSPVTHLLGDWDKATGVGLIFNGVSPENIVAKSADNRSAKLTPKTLLFSPDSDNSPVSDNNQTPPVNQETCSPGNGGTNNLSQENNHSVNCTRNDEANSLSQKLSIQTMPIKQKLKSRAWDADLRSLLSQDFEDVCIQEDSTDNEITISQNKTAQNVSKNQSARKVKKSKESKKGSRKNENISDDKGHTESNVLKESETELQHQPASDVTKSNIVNINNVPLLPCTNDKEYSDLMVNKNKKCDVVNQENNSTSESTLEKGKSISKKRRAGMKALEERLRKRPKGVDVEQTGEKTVEEKLETMFSEESYDSSGLDLNNMQGREISTRKKELSCTNSNILVDLVSPSRENNGTKSSEVVVNMCQQTSNEILEESAGNDKNNSGDISQTDHVCNAETRFQSEKILIHENASLKPSPHSSKCGTITSDVPKSSEQSSEISNRRNSEVSGKTNTNKEQDANLETPVKHDAKYLFKNFNPLTPAPVDRVFPMTPRVLSPSHQEDTPITKLLRCEPSINYSMIVTPSLPPTPNIVISPNSDTHDSPTSYTSRPTDYSSCSSYYNPSKSIDTPTKLEQELIKECSRMEQNNEEKSHEEERNVLNEESSSVKLIDIGEENQNNNLTKTDLTGVPVFQLSISLSRNESNKNEGGGFSPADKPKDSMQNSQTSEMMPESISCSNSPVEETSPIPNGKLVNVNVDAQIVDCVSDPESHIRTFVIEKGNLNEEYQPVQNVSENKDDRKNNHNEDIEKLPQEMRTFAKSESCLPNERTNLLTVCNITQKDIALVAGVTEMSVIPNTEQTWVSQNKETQETTSKSNKKENSVEGESLQVPESDTTLAVSNTQKKDLTFEENCDKVVNAEAEKYNEKERDLSDNAIKKETIIKMTVSANVEKTSVPNKIVILENEDLTGESFVCDVEGMKNKEPMNTSDMNSLSNDQKNTPCRMKEHAENESHENIHSGAKCDTKCERPKKELAVMQTQKDEIVSCSIELQQVELIEPMNKTPHSKLSADKTDLQDIGTKKKEAKPSTKETEDLKQHDSSLEKITNKNNPNLPVNKENKIVEKTTTKEHKKVLVKKSSEKSPKKIIGNKKQKETPSKENTKLASKKTKELLSQEPVEMEKKSNYILTNKMFANESGHHSKQRFTKKKVLEKKYDAEMKGKSSSKLDTSLNDHTSKTKTLVNKNGQCKNIQHSRIKQIESKKTHDSRNHNLFENDTKLNQPIKKKEDQTQPIELKENKKQSESKISYSETIVVYNKDDVVEIEKSAVQECVNLNSAAISGSDEDKVKEAVKKPDTMLESEKYVESKTVEEKILPVESMEEISTLERNLAQKDFTDVQDRNPMLENNSSSHTQNNSINKDCTSPSDTSISKNNEEIALDNTANNLEKEGVLSEISTDNEQSSESDSETSSNSSSDSSDDSSDDSSRDSSDDSSHNSSHSQISFTGEKDKVNTEPNSLYDSFLTKVSEDSRLENSSKSDEVSINEKKEFACKLQEQTNCDNINEILKSISAVSLIHKDEGCFASQLDEKRRRTLARLKGTDMEEVKKKMVSANTIGSKDNKKDKPSRLQPQNNICSEENPNRDSDKNWEESSIEEFPVLHFSDSESTGIPTPHVSPVKSTSSVISEINDETVITLNQEKCDMTIICTVDKQESEEKDKLECRENFPKDLDDDVQEDCASGNEDGSKNISHHQTCNVSEKSNEQNQTNQEVVPNEYDPSKFEETGKLEDFSCVNRSELISVTKLQENEIFMTLQYVGNICPDTVSGDCMDFCYDLEGDDMHVTIVGSSYQDLLEIFPRESENTGIQHLAGIEEKKNESKCSLENTIDGMERKSDSKGRHDSSPANSSIFDEKSVSSQRHSSTVRPLDLLYKELVEGEGSSSLSNETNNMHQKGRSLRSLKYDRRKTYNVGRQHQKIQKKTSNDEHKIAESIRYKSPLELLPEYKMLERTVNSSLHPKTDHKKYEESTNKKESSISQREKSVDLEEGEILDSPVKEGSTMAAKTNRGGSVRHGIHIGSRRSSLPESLSHSHSTHKSKSRSSDATKRESTNQHEKTIKHQSLASSSRRHDVRSLPPKKRKAISDDNLKEPEKRSRHDNPCKLLKNLNIDSFLNKVHGEDTSK